MSAVYAEEPTSVRTWKLVIILSPSLSPGDSEPRPSSFYLSFPSWDSRVHISGGSQGGRQPSLSGYLSLPALICANSNPVGFLWCVHTEQVTSSLKDVSKLRALDYEFDVIVVLAWWPVYITACKIIYLTVRASFGASELSFLNHFSPAT